MSATKLVCQIEEVLYDDVERVFRREVRRLIWTVFRWSTHEGSSKSTLRGRQQIAIVSRYQHALLGFEP
jgi:hypothetical protein